jgi:hypothetical protein
MVTISKSEDLVPFLEAVESADDPFAVPNRLISDARGFCTATLYD